MSDSLASSITRVLMESTNTDLSGRFTLFALYNDNSAVLHIFEDEREYEEMKHKFTSNDGIKRLGASRLPENTTFGKLSESLERKFGVPREGMTVRNHPKQEPKPQKPVEEARKPQMKPTKSSVVESVLKGKERFTTPQTNPQPVTEVAADEPRINSFRPAVSKKIDLSRLNNGETPPMLG